MAEAYISELGDSLSHGVANTNGDRVKIIAPKLYNDGNGNHPSIATALDNRLVATSGTKALTWGSSTTIGTVGGSDVKISLPANPDTDVKVTQTVDTSNDAAYPLLAKNTTATATITDTSRFTSGVTLNPKNKSITATTFIGALSGNATTAASLSVNSISYHRPVASSGDGKQWCRLGTLTDTAVTEGAQWFGIGVIFNVYSNPYGTSETHLGCYEFSFKIGIAARAEGAAAYSLKTSGTMSIQKLYGPDRPAADNERSGINFRIVRSDTKVELFIKNSEWDSSLYIERFRQIDGTGSYGTWEWSIANGLYTEDEFTTYCSDKTVVNLTKRTGFRSNYSDIARAVVDYGNTTKALEIGFSGDAVTSPAYFAVYTDSSNGYNKAIKDCSLANVKKAINGTSKGSATQPVYIDANGAPTAIDCTIATSVPSGAVFTDTKVKLTDKSSDTGSYPLVVVASASPTSGTAYEGYYDTGVTLTPNTNTISANISGNAATATKPKYTSLTSTDDLNNAVGSVHGDVMWYQWSSGSAPANVPTTGTSEMEVVRMHDGNYCTQTVYVANNETVYRRINKNGTWGSWYAYSKSTHTHGNITNGGALQSTDITVASGDKLVVTDASDSNKVARTSLAFDGSTATKALTQKGTWETFNNYSLPLAASETRGGIQIGYSESGTNYAVKLSSEKAYVTVPWTDTKQTTAVKNTTKGYISAVETAAATQTGIVDEGVFLTTTAGQLQATSYKVTANATMQYNSTDAALEFVFS